MRNEPKTPAKWLMYVFQATDEDAQVILVVDGDCIPRCLGADLPDVVDWLASVGQTKIGIDDGAGVTDYRIEPPRPPMVLRRVSAPPRDLLDGKAGAPPLIRDASAALVLVDRLQARRPGRPRLRRQRVKLARRLLLP